MSVITLKKEPTIATLDSPPSEISLPSVRDSVTPSGDLFEGSSTSSEHSVPEVSIARVSTKSPGKKTELRNNRLILLQADEFSYTLDQLSLANIREPLPTYQYLENCVTSSKVRCDLLNEIKLALKMESMSLYPTYIDQNLITRYKVNSDTIPALTTSLRNWMRTVATQNAATLPTLFLCIMKPDPLSDPNLIGLYQKMLQKDVKDCGSWMATKVSEFNSSQKLLAEVLGIALEKSLKLSKTNSEMHKMLTRIKDNWTKKTNCMIIFTFSRFWKNENGHGG
jgi:hypothetical protein